MGEPSGNPGDMTVDAVEWLPSGARSGLVRVRGRRDPKNPAALPLLVLEHAGQSRRYASLPDSRVERDAGGWRGAYVVDVAIATASETWFLQWDDGSRTPLAAPEVTPPTDAPEAEPVARGGDVVDRAVLAERRARRAEAAAQAQARVASEALKAVEVLELRSAEVERRLQAAHAERDALRDRLAERGPGDSALRSELEHLRAQLARREPEEPAPAMTDAERRALRLRDALAQTLRTVAELRLQLHEAQVHRRTREVAWNADAVRLIVLEREHGALREAFEATSAELAAARAARDAASLALDEARAVAAGAEAAHQETRQRFAERVGELREARERIAALEATIAAVRAEAERSAAEAADAARAEAQAAVMADADARVAEAEAVIAELQERLASSEAVIGAAETAREIAEAAALAATAERRAAEVAHAARAVPPAEPRPLDLPARRSGADLGGALAAAADRLKAPPPEPERALAARRVAQDLDAAAEQLRRRATVVSAPGEPPGDLVRGRAGRDYPPLRGALVKLAHDDAPAAARLIAGLLEGLGGDVSFDLTIAELGTFAVRGGGAVERVEAPRGRRRASFHARADALALAELLAGVGPRPGRMGRVRVSGSVRKARAVAGRAAQPRSLADVVGAGARLDPVLVLRCLAYAVHPSWTRGHAFTVAQEVGGQRVRIRAHDGRGLSVSTANDDAEPHARVTLTPEAFRALLAGETPRERPVVRGDHTAVEQLRAWADRARRGE